MPQSGPARWTCMEIAGMVSTASLISIAVTSHPSGSASARFTFIFIRSFYKRFFLPVERSIETQRTSEHHQECARTILCEKRHRAQWCTVLTHDARGKLLEIARSGKWQQVITFLSDIGADCGPSPPLLGTCAEKVSDHILTEENRE